MLLLLFSGGGAVSSHAGAAILKVYELPATQTVAQIPV